MAQKGGSRPPGPPPPPPGSATGLPSKCFTHNIFLQKHSLAQIYLRQRFLWVREVFKDIVQAYRNAPPGSTWKLMPQSASEANWCHGHTPIRGDISVKGSGLFVTINSSKTTFALKDRLALRASSIHARLAALSYRSYRHMIPHVCVGPAPAFPWSGFSPLRFTASGKTSGLVWCGLVWFGLV